MLFNIEAIFYGLHFIRARSGPALTNVLTKSSQSAPHAAFQAHRPRQRALSCNRTPPLEIVPAVLQSVLLRRMLVCCCARSCVWEGK